MSITVLYSMAVAVPEDCRQQQFGDPTCPGHRAAMDAVAWRYADAAIAAAVREWLHDQGNEDVVVDTSRNGDTDDAFGLVVEGDAADALWGVNSGVKGRH